MRPKRRVTSVSAAHCAQKAAKVTFLVNSKPEKAI